MIITVVKIPPMNGPEEARGPQKVCKNKFRTTMTTPTRETASELTNKHQNNNSFPTANDIERCKEEAADGKVAVGSGLHSAKAHEQL